jgi:hypothetical protein
VSIPLTASSICADLVTSASPVCQSVVVGRECLHTLLRASAEWFLEECPTDAAVGACDQNCFVFDVHIVLRVCSICSYCSYYGCGRGQDTSESNFLKVHVRAYLHAISAGPAAHTASGAMMVFPGRVNEYSTARGFEPLALLAINPEDSRLRRVLVSIR